MVNVFLAPGATPHGHWTITTIFTVSQADAGASVRKSLQRLVGTLVGGLAGILVVIALADLPVLYVPVLGAVVAFGIFASVTTSAPYVMLLGTLTFVLVAASPPGAGTTAVETGLWRILAVAIGVVCGTGAQIFLWPDDPEAKLREALAARLSSVAGAVRARARGTSRSDGAAFAPTLAGDDLTVQLDLLANAEARHPSLRRRHVEQLALIVEVDRLLTAAAWLVGAAGNRGADRGEQLRELEAIGEECSRLAEALTAGRPPAGPPPDLDASNDASGPAGLAPTLADMKLALHRSRDALGFLDPDRPVAAPDLDRPTRTPLLTPAFSFGNRDAVAQGLKAALGFEICYVLMHALDWPALLTASITAVLITQASFGATVQKSMLRLAGALLGGALGIAAIVVAMPNIESLGSLLVVAGAGFGIAAWITAGSSRISYMGLQTGMAFAIAATDPAGPTTDLTTARDRVVGILIGVLAMLFVNATLWPARARLGMWSALARALRSIANLARITPEARAYRAQVDRAIHLRSAVYQQLAATLRLSSEAGLEPDAAESQPEREWVGHLAAHAQAVFLAVLALIRHRVAPGFPVLPPVVQEAMAAADRSVADALDGLADRLDDGRPGPLPDLAGRLADVEALIPAEADATAPGAGSTARVGEVDHVAIARDLVRQVGVLREAIDAASASRRR